MANNLTRVGAMLTSIGAARAPRPGAMRYSINGARFTISMKIAKQARWNIPTQIIDESS